MREKIDCFLPDFDRQAMEPTIEQLRLSSTVKNIYWAAGMSSTADIMDIAESTRAATWHSLPSPRP